MNTREFFCEYPDLICSAYGEEQFATLKILCPGLSSPKLGKLLNRATSYLDGNEVYLELGTYVGYSLVCASLHNVQTTCIGIDNFKLLGDKTTSERVGWVKARLKTNMDHFNYGNQQIIDSDYKEITSLEKPIGVFFIDAEHTRKEVYNCLNWGHGKLADNAIVFIDDISIWNVGDGVKDWLKEHDEYVEVFHIDTFHKEYRFRPEDWNNTFWNGLSILKFERHVTV